MFFQFLPPISSIVPQGGRRAARCSWIWSFLLSLISPSSSWQASCKAISGNKNSFHTSLLIFPLLCSLLKSLPLPLLKKLCFNYWKLCSAHCGPQGFGETPGRWGEPRPSAWCLPSRSLKWPCMCLSSILLPKSQNYFSQLSGPAVSSIFFLSSVGCICSKEGFRRTAQLW